MEQPRYGGTLKNWHAERGFGFVAPDEGEQDIFVHISAFARDGRQPTVGERLTFEVQPDRNGKRSAVRVRRAGDAAPSPRAVQRHPRRSDRREREGTGLFGRLISGLVLMGIAGLGYVAYDKRSARFDAPLPSVPAQLSSAKLPVPTAFRCDGRNMCSQMSSCQEATLFLQNCPGMKLDGNGDGVPCEQQWCTR